MPKKAPRALAWTIRCDNDLLVTVVVCDKYILLRSAQPDTSNPWRLGAYVNAEEAGRRAVEMTSSYERLRHGVMGSYTDLLLPIKEWTKTTESSDVDPLVGLTVDLALSSAGVSD